MISVNSWLSWLLMHAKVVCNPLDALLPLTGEGHQSLS